jgi:hypothetical protein
MTSYIDNCFKKQHIGFVMPNIVTITCKLGQESEPSKERIQSKSGQVTYMPMVPMSTQFGKRETQTYEVPSRVTISISRPQTIYTSPMMMTQANRSMGWPPPIVLNYERYRIGLVVNFGARGSVARPY